MGFWFLFMGNFRFIFFFVLYTLLVNGTKINNLKNI